MGLEQGLDFGHVTEREEVEAIEQVEGIWGLSSEDRDEPQHARLPKQAACQPLNRRGLERIVRISDERPNSGRTPTKFGRFVGGRDRGPREAGAPVIS